MHPILSIIIPTKNRQYTALYAIETALKIKDNNIEIIIQDCSDTNVLKQQIEAKFRDDNRIKYNYTSEPVSMTENWNIAISNSRGKYLCAIGDDDAVLPIIIDIVYWMNDSDADAVLPLFVTYIWKDAYVGTLSNGRLTFPKHFDGKIFKIDLEAEFITKTIDCGFGYTENLPNLYHGIIKKEILEKNKVESLNYLNGTSLDAYCAIALSKYIKTLYFVNLPITIRGACGSSNTNRIVTNKVKSHFDEIKAMTIPECLPQIYTSEVSIAESCITALKDSKNTEFIAHLNLAIVYGKSAAVNLKLFFKLYKKYKICKNIGYDNKVFFKYFTIFLKERIKSFLLNKILIYLYRYFPGIVENSVEKFIPNKIKVKIDDINLAVEYLNSYMESKKISFENKGEIMQLSSKKQVWH
jgi:glycosyltransferase involved in cell wall biosynthesis